MQQTDCELRILTLNYIKVRNEDLFNHLDYSLRILALNFEEFH